MLRVRPTTISLTATEVREVEARRRNSLSNDKQSDNQSAFGGRCPQSPDPTCPPFSRQRRPSICTDEDMRINLSALSLDQARICSSHQFNTSTQLDALHNEAEGSSRRSDALDQLSFSARLLSGTPKSRFHIGLPGILTFGVSEMARQQQREGALPDGINICGLTPHSGLRGPGDAVVADCSDGEGQSPSKFDSALQLPAPFSETPRRISVDSAACMPKGYGGQLEPTSMDSTRCSSDPFLPSNVRGPSPSPGSGNVKDKASKGDISQIGPVHHSPRKLHDEPHAAETRRALSPPLGDSEAGEVGSIRPTVQPISRNSRLRIYNDSLPRAQQPETPDNLPEARHRSRLHGPFTAPARHRSPLPRHPTNTRRRRHGGGNPSPEGLRTPGFHGLYGGIENTDDSTLFEQAERDRDYGATEERPRP